MSTSHFGNLQSLQLTVKFILSPFDNLDQNMVDAKIRESKLHDIAHFGIRSVAGVLFIVHSLGKFNPEFQNFFTTAGLPVEMQFLIAFLELIGGILLVLGILTRISSSLLALEMLGVIIYLKKLKSFSGQGGVELDLLHFLYF